MTLANEITNAFKNFKTFTFNDVKMVFANKQKNISDKTIQVTLSRMVKSKRLYKITKGVFSLVKRDEIAGFAFTPFYYGGIAALMIRDLIDNQVKMEIMTTRRVRRSIVEVYEGSSIVVVHHLPKKYYFGFEDLKYGSIVIPVSNPEKTLIDLFYYKQRLPLRDYAEILKHIRMKVLRRYLNAYDKRTAKTVMGFIKKHRHAAMSDELANPY